MSKLRNMSRLFVSLAVAGTLVLAMTGIAFADGITIPGTEIQLPDVLPEGVTEIVENVTEALPVPELPVPDALEETVNTVTGTLEGPVQNIAGQIPVVNTLTGTDAASTLTDIPAGSETMTAFDPSNLSPEALTSLLDPSQLPLPDLPTLGDLPLIGTLLDLLDPANLPALDDLPLIGALLPILDSVLDKLAEIPILKPIIQIVQRLLSILRPADPTPTPTPTPATPEAPVVPSANAPAVVAGVESPAGDSFDHLPYTGADFTGILFLIACLIVSVLLVYKVEGSVKRSGFRKSSI